MVAVGPGGPRQPIGGHSEPPQANMENRSVEQRQHLVFRAVVREHLRTAEPVASGPVSARYRFGVSPATIRNDMADLETAGLLMQPHTSAGRVPTDAGYRFYVETFAACADGSPACAEIDGAAETLAREDGVRAKDFTRQIAEFTGETVFLTFGDGRSYLAGVTHLVRKPEFSEPELLLGISELVDDFDRVFDDMCRRLERDFAVFIGRENPFGDPFSTIVTRFAAKRLGEGAVGILGPKRMDYDANLALMRHLGEILSRI